VTGLPNRIELLDGRPLGQVGIVVADLERALERYSVVAGVGPWRCWTYGPESVTRLTYRGSPGDYRIRIALSSVSPQIELLQPLEGGGSHAEFLEAHGEGLHHVAVFVDSLDDAIESMARAGYDVLQSGHGIGADGSGGVAYFDTERDLSLILEAVEIPRRRREPDFVWPTG
jgi:hypothetical protein